MMMTSLDFLQNCFELDGVYIEGSYSRQSILLTKNFQSSQNDVYLVTYPRSGTTWTQNILVGLYFGSETLSNLDHPEMKRLFPYLEFHYSSDDLGTVRAAKIDSNPRFLKTHLPCNLAPEEIFTQKRKCIVVLRNPKDVALSYYKFYSKEKPLRELKRFETLPEFLDLFLEGNVLYGSWWVWAKGWLEKSRLNPAKYLIVHYENYHENFEETVRKLLQFIGEKNIDSKTLDDVKRQTEFETMKNRYINGPNAAIMNEGKSLSWKTEFPKEYVEKFDRLTKEYIEEELVDKFL